jgi:hypothetical protein
MRRFLRVFPAAMLFSAAAWAQVAGSGAITGMIRDNFGEGLPDATVTLSNPALGIQRTMITTVDGVFNASGLVPSSGYGLSVSRKGFADWKSNNFPLTVGQKLRFTISLQATTAAEGQAGVASARIDEAGSGFASAVTREQIENLPLTGRRWTAAALLAPATGPGGTFGPLALAGGPYANAFLIDGIDVTERFYRANDRQSRPLPQDAVEEIAVTGGNSAESGRAMGGTVDVVARTGSNDIHGGLYEYYRKPGLNADDRYALGRDLPQKQHQAGASLGGPLVPDRLFYFANIEALDGRSDTLNRITNPLIADPLGVSVLPSNCTATAAQCAAAIKFVQSQMNVNVERPVHSVAGLGKMDIRGERQSLSLVANLMKWRSRNGLLSDVVAPDGGLLGNNGDAVHQTRFLRAGWTSMLGDSASNELRAGWWQDRFSESSPDRPALSTGHVAISIAGAAVGASTVAPGSFNEQRYQLGDTLAFTAGAHSVRFGGDFSRTKDRINQIRNAAGTYSYPSLTAFALDLAAIAGKNYSSFTQTLGDPFRSWHSTEAAVFAQDTWRLLPRLTVELGLRWEKPFLPRPPYGNSDYWQTATIASPNADFAPRFGAAYALDEHTTLRAGYGRFYAPFSGELLDALYGGGQYDVTLMPSQTGAKVFPYVISAVKAIPTGTKSLTFGSNKVRNPYAKQVNLTLERRLAEGTTVSAGYIGSNGAKLWSVKDINLVEPTKTATYAIADAAGNSVGSYATPYWTGRSDPRYAHLYEIGNGASSWYNALALQFRQRMWRGVTVQASYTWSHALDNAGANGLIGFGVGNTFSNNFENDKGASATDQRHRASINWVWQPRLGAGAPAVARTLVNGWELSGIATLASGQPSTPIVIAAGQQFSGMAPAYASSLNGSGGWARVPFLDVNSLRAAPLRNLDARVARSFWIGERLKASLMIEAFNAFNAQYDTRVNTIAYTASAGVLHPVSALGAGISTTTYPDGTNARRCQLALRVTF